MFGYTSLRGHLIPSLPLMVILLCSELHSSFSDTKVLKMVVRASKNGVFNTLVSPVFSGLARGFCKSIAFGCRSNAFARRGNAFTT